MALPDPVRVKISSEAAEYVALTPVVVQELPLAEFLPLILSATGKDAVRVGEILRRGTLVSGASRFRWQPVSAAAAEIGAALEAIPNPEPTRPFSAADCVRIIIVAGRRRIEIAREHGERRRLFRRRSFWQEIMPLLSAAQPAYVGYIYRQRLDQYRVTVTLPLGGDLRNLSGLLAYSALTRQIRSMSPQTIDLYAGRSS